MPGLYQDTYKLLLLSPVPQGNNCPCFRVKSTRYIALLRSFEAVSLIQGEGLVEYVVRVVDQALQKSIVLGGRMDVDNLNVHTVKNLSSPYPTNKRLFMSCTGLTCNVFEMIWNACRLIVCKMMVKVVKEKRGR